MEDVGSKPPTRRSTTATSHLGPTAFRLLWNNHLAKGDAGNMGALIPLCNLPPLDRSSVGFDLDAMRPLLLRTPRLYQPVISRWIR